MNRKQSLALSACVAAMFSVPAMAQFSTDGLFVVRLGDAASPVSGAAAQKVYLDEYTASTGAFVRSIGLDYTGSTAFTLSGTSNLDDGHLNLSTDGQSLVLGGYRANLGFNEPQKSSASDVPRVIATVNAAGTANTSLALNDAYNNVVIAAVISDGQHFWTGGAYSTTDNAASVNSGGLRYVEGPGSTTSTNISARTIKAGSNEPDSLRNIRFVGNEIYVNTPAQKSFVNRGVYAMSQTTPGGTQVATPVIVNHEGQNIDDAGNVDKSGQITGKWYPKTDAVFFDLDPTVPGYDVAYGTGGKEDYHKWSLVFNPSENQYEWIRNTQAFVGGQDSGLEINALDARLVDGTVELFATLDQGVLKLQDTAGYNAAMSSLFADPDIDTGAGFFFTAGSGTQFRGLALVPEPTMLALGLFGLMAIRRRRA